MLSFRQQLPYVIGQHIEKDGLIHCPVGSGSYCQVNFFSTHRGEDQDWNVFELRLQPDLFDHLDAIETWHADIGYYEVGKLGTRNVKSFATVTGENDGKPFGGQVEVSELARVEVIVDDEYLLRHT